MRIAKKIDLAPKVETREGALPLPPRYVDRMKPVRIDCGCWSFAIKFLLWATRNDDR